MGKGAVSEELKILLFCKQMKWTYTQYMKQPRWFVEALSGLLDEDTRDANKKNRKLK